MESGSSPCALEAAGSLWRRSIQVLDRPCIWYVRFERERASQAPGSGLNLLCIPPSPLLATQKESSWLPKMATSGTTYHVLFKTSLMLIRARGAQSSRRLRDFEKFAKRNGVDSLVVKIGASPGLIYADSKHLCRLRAFATEVQRQSRGARTFTPVVPPMEAPVFTQARLADNAFSKVTHVEGMDAFAAEMVNGGLEHWWIDVSRQQLFSARS